MKKIIYTLLICSISLLSSCLKKNVEEIENFSDNQITDIAGVWFRYVTPGGTAENPTTEVLKMVQLNGITKSIDKETRTITIKVAPTASIINQIPAANLKELTIKNIAVVVSLPTAARVSPVGDAPKFGINGDWSVANKYVVTAANGDKAEWTINFTELKLP